MIYDFIHAALPFIIIGLVLAVFFAFRSKSNSENNYSTTGMALGMCFGSLFGLIGGFVRDEVFENQSR